MNVVEFLRQAARSKSPQHCSTDAADWAISQGWPDFAWAWRGSLTEMQCEAATVSVPLVALWDEGIGDTLPMVEGEIQAGDIAVVTKLGLDAGAVYTGERWAIRSGDDIVYVPFGSVSVIKAWRVLNV